MTLVWRYLLIGGHIAVPLYLFTLENRIATIIACVILILLPAFGLTVIHLIKNMVTLKRFNFLTFIQVYYGRIVFPANYSSDQSDELVSRIISARMVPIKEVFSVNKMLTHLVTKFGFLSLCAFLFFTGTLQLIFEFSGMEYSAITQTPLIVLNSMSKGAVFDFFESFGLELYKSLVGGLLFNSIDFVIRTTTSLLVIGGLYESTLTYQYRRIYYGEMKTIDKKFSLLYQLETLLNNWSSSLSAESYNVTRQRIAEIVLPYIWKHDGPGSSMSYEEYKKYAEEKNPGRLAIERLFYYEYLDNWKLTKQQQKRFLDDESNI